MKKVIFALVVLALSITFLVGCGNGDEAPQTVTVWFMGGSVEYDGDVIEAANARLQELGVNVEINPVWTGGWGMGEPAQVALDTGDSSIDVVWTGSWGLDFWVNARVGNFVRLDDPDNNLLGQYGQAMRATVPQELWDAFTIDGPGGLGIYGIPGYKDYAQMYAWDVNNTRLSELGFDFYDLFDPDGVNYAVFFDPMFEAALQAAKDTWGPTFFPLTIEPELFARAASNADFDLTGLHVFNFGFDPENPANPAEPVIGLNLENDLYLRILERLHHFFNQGFIDPRLAIPGEAATVLVEARNAGEYLFSQIVYAYGHTATASAAREIDARFPPMSRPIVSSVSAAGSGFAISVYSQNQAAAMQFMNAWYTDNELAVILSEGLEGTHWNWYVDEDGTSWDGQLLELDPTGRANYSPWRFGMGNIFVLTPRNTDGLGYFERFGAYNAAGIGTGLLGFTFNSENVSSEMAALTGIVGEFNQALTVGATNPGEIVPQYLEALRANGIDIVMEELNSQIRDFLAAR
ncbi:MAG: ABC transporter substrate-binding protein [Oscillospiraceae bacterium]|nr:ABC transporter substrate-binding protein [Oscillospiraceae bacterium]